MIIKFLHIDSMYGQLSCNFVSSSMGVLYFNSYSYISINVYFIIVNNCDIIDIKEVRGKNYQILYL